MAADDPIGVFDSGVGGLSVLHDVRRELPHEHLLYVADSVHAPYGDRTQAFVEARSIAIVRFLVTQGAKAIVVACNTATSMAVDALRSEFSLPCVAMEPAVKPAVSITKSGVIGVLATTATLSSPRFARLVSHFGSDVDVVLQACPGLVEHVEKGELAHDATRALVEQYVRPLVARGADTLVLGCTHYPFLATLIQEAAGPRVVLVDPGVAVARELRRRLTVEGLLSAREAPGVERLWTSGSVDQVQSVVSRLWRSPVIVENLPSA